MQVPRITKITLNMGVGEAVADKKILDNAVGRHDRRSPARSRWSPRRARRSPASRSATASRSAAWSRCAARACTSSSTAWSRSRCRACATSAACRAASFDGRGNYNIGVKEQIIFPEIEYDKIDALRGMNITITTTAKTDDEAKALLAAFKFPVQELKAHDMAKTRTDQAREEARASWSRSTRRSARS